MQGNVSGPTTCYLRITAGCCFPKIIHMMRESTPLATIIPANNSLYPLIFTKQVHGLWKSKSKVQTHLSVLFSYFSLKHFSLHCCPVICGIAVSHRLRSIGADSIRYAGGNRLLLFARRKGSMYLNGCSLKNSVVESRCNSSPPAWCLTAVAWERGEKSQGRGQAASLKGRREEKSGRGVEGAQQKTCSVEKGAWQRVGGRQKRKWEKYFLKNKTDKGWAWMSWPNMFRCSSADVLFESETFEGTLSIFKVK